MLDGSFLRHENSLGNRLMLTEFLGMHRRGCSKSFLLFSFCCCCCCFNLSTWHYQWLGEREALRPRFTELRFQMTLCTRIFMSAHVIAVLSDFSVQAETKELAKPKKKVVSPKLFIYFNFALAYRLILYVMSDLYFWHHKLPHIGKPLSMPYTNFLVLTLLNK